MSTMHGSAAASDRDAAAPESLWDAKNVAAYLKVSRTWVYDHAEAGTLPAVRIGGLLRFHREEIRAFARGEWRPAAAVLPMKGRPGR